MTTPESLDRAIDAVLAGELDPSSVVDPELARLLQTAADAAAAGGHMSAATSLSTTAMLNTRDAILNAPAPLPGPIAFATEAVHAAHVAITSTTAAVSSITIAAAAIGTVGLATASEQAVPGDLLHPVKDLIADVRLATSGSDAEAALHRSAEAIERLVELEGLVERGADRDAIVALLDQVELETLLAVEDLAAAAAALGDLDLADEANALAQAQQLRLMTITEDLTDDLLADADRVAQTLDAAVVRAEVSRESVVAAIERDARPPASGATPQPGATVTPDATSEPLPTPTLPQPTETTPSTPLPSSTPSIDVPTPTVPLPTPTVSLPTPTLPLPSPTVPLPSPTLPIPTALPSLPTDGVAPITSPIDPTLGNVTLG